MSGFFKKKIKDVRFFFRDIIFNKKNRKKLRNREFTIIGSDCTAGCVCKDLKVRMNSPTRNFYFDAGDYIKFCKNLEYYLQLTPREYNGNYKGEGKQYLMAALGDLKMFLVHYDTIKQFQEEWKRRVSRVNMNNLFFLMNDRNGCTDYELREFENLPYRNKICFTHVRHSELKSTYYLSGSENEPFLRSVMDYVKPWWIKRYYDQFDFVKWLNQDMEQEEVCRLKS